MSTREVGDLRKVELIFTLTYARKKQNEHLYMAMKYARCFLYGDEALKLFLIRMRSCMPGP